MKTWEIVLDTNTDGVEKAILTGPKNQKLEIVCSLKDNKVFGLDVDYNNDTLLGELYRAYCDDYKYPISPAPVLSWELEKTDPDLKETCYDYSHCFESLVEARNDYLTLVDALERAYEEYKSIKVEASVQAHSYTFTCPNHSKCLVEEDFLVNGFFTEICKEDDFWDFVETLEIAYSRLWSGK